MRIEFHEYLWLALGAWSLACLIGAWRWVGRPRRWRAGIPGPWCRRCGYSLHARAPLPETCPECGAALTDAAVVQPSKSDWPYHLRVLAWMLAGLALTTMAVTLTPKALSLFTDHHVRQVRRAEYHPDQPDLTVFDQIVIIESGYEWVWLGDVHGPRRPQPLRVELVPDPVELPNGPRIEMVVQPYTLAYGYATADGKQVAETRALDEPAFLAWMAQIGLNTHDPRLRSEVALVLSGLRGIATTGVRPNLSEDAPLNWRPHTPGWSLRSYYPLWAPVLVLIVCQVAWLWIADRRLTGARAASVAEAGSLDL